MKKFLFMLLLLPAALLADTWNVLIYMEAVDGLHEAAWKNINELARAESNQHSTICVQLHAYGNIAWRYTIRHHHIVQVEEVQLENNYLHDINNALNWAFDHPADHYGLILWGYGYGILEPSWNDEKKEWMLEDDELMHDCLTCKRGHRAYLVSERNKNFLSNNGMISALEHAHNLIGKKIDIFGLDSCLGASIEHAYQVAHCVDYLVACQNCELHDGFEYHEFGQALAQGLSPRKIAKSMVENYGVYYANHEPKGTYTLSALNCSLAHEIKKSLDAVLTNLVHLLEEHPELIQQVRKQIRYHCPHFCFVPMYTDLFEILETVHEIFEDAATIFNPEVIRSMLNSIKECKSHLHEFVIASTEGHAMHQAHGVSIYCPLSTIDSSYPLVPFAQEGNWLEFLEQLIKRID